MVERITEFLQNGSVQPRKALTPGRCPYCGEPNLLKAEICVRCHGVLPPLPPQILRYLCDQTLLNRVQTLWAAFAVCFKYFAISCITIGSLACGFIICAISLPELWYDQSMYSYEIPSPMGTGPLVLTRRQQSNSIGSYIRIAEKPIRYAELPSPSEISEDDTFSWSQDGTLVARFNSSGKCMAAYDLLLQTGISTWNDSKRDDEVRLLFQQRGGIGSAFAYDTRLEREISLQDYWKIESSMKDAQPGKAPS